MCSMQQIYDIHNVVQMQLISYIHNVGRWRHLTHQLLVLTNQTKLTLTVTLTLTDTVILIFFFMHFINTDKKVVSQ